MAEKQEKDKVEAAVVKGMVVEQKDSILDDLIEKIDMDATEKAVVFRILDRDLTKEITDQLSGHYDASVIYNKPFASENGKVDWGHLCDVMNYGKGCSYRKKGKKHVHVTGVGYQGALVAMRAYGQMSVTVDKCPELKEEGGELIWMAYAEAHDHHTNITIGRWYGEKLMLATRGGVIEKEHAMSIAESKAMRNVILALLPKDLMQKWMDDYRTGGKSFDPKRTKEMGYNKSARPKPAKKATPKAEVIAPEVKKQYDGMVGQLATKMGIDSKELVSFLQSSFGTTGQRTLNVNRALNDESTMENMKASYEEWSKAVPAEPKEDLFGTGKTHNPPE